MSIHAVPFVTETCVGVEGAVPPSSSHLQTAISHTLYLDLSAAKNPSHFIGLSLKPIFEHLKYSVMLHYRKALQSA